MRLWSLVRQEREGKRIVIREQQAARDYELTFTNSPGTMPSRATRPAEGVEVDQ